MTGKKQGWRSWDDQSRLVHEIGGESHIAERMQAERLARGWSQSELARQLAAAGFGWLDQPAISAIESPRAGSKKRRNVRVEEAIALARVFEVPLSDLLLPAGTMDNIEARRAIAAGGDNYRVLRSAVGMYAADLQHVAKLTADPWWDHQLSEAITGWQEEMDQIAEQQGGHGRVTTAQRRYWKAKDDHTFLVHLQRVRAGADPWEVARSA